MAGFPGKSNRPPVDPYTGAGDAPASPGYVVEPPQPVTTVSPPPPQPLPFSRVKKEPTAPPARVSPTPFSTARPQMPQTPVTPSAAPTPKPEPAQALANSVPPVTLPAFVVDPVEDDGTIGSGTTAPASTPSTTATVSNPTRLPEPAPYAAISAPSAPEPMPYSAPANNSTANANSSSFEFVADRIRLLYEQVNEDLSDSPTVGDYAMNTLKLAREALLKQDFASAEFYVQTVEAKLKRSEMSMKMSRSPKMWLLYGWEFMMLLVSALFIAVTYTGSGKLMGIAVAPEFLALLRAVGWGGIGGVIGALYNLPWFVQFREYDPAYNMNYVVRPLQGLLIGGVLFLLSSAGVLAGSLVIPGLSTEVDVGPVFLYLLAAMAGFKQEYVFEFLDGILKAIFRVPQVPNELKTPVPPLGVSTYNEIK